MSYVSAELVSRVLSGTARYRSGIAEHGGCAWGGTERAASEKKICLDASCSWTGDSQMGADGAAAGAVLPRPPIRQSNVRVGRDGRVHGSTAGNNADKAGLTGGGEPTNPFHEERTP